MTQLKNIILTAAIVLFAFLLGADAIHHIPEFELNLDLPPAQRWNGAVKTIVDLHGWANSFGPVIDLYVPVFMLLPENVTTQITAYLEKFYPDVAEEVTSIGRDLAAYGCSLCNTSKMHMMVYFYELSHMSLFKNVIPAEMRRSCTGILSLPKDPHADMIHGRNMDESPAPGRNMTLMIRVMKGGKHVYTMLDWTWITAGIATTSRMGGVTLEMNWNNDGPDTTLDQILNRIVDPKTVPILQAFRVINDAQMNFTQTVDFVMTSQFASPFYNIISGAGRQGAILTIEWDATQNVAELLNETSPISFMVQTNYDRWLPDQGLMRRTVAEDALKMLGRERSGSELGVWMALSTYPVHNPSTLFSALMSVGKHPEAYIRDAMIPNF